MVNNKDFQHKFNIFEWLAYVGNIHYVNKDAVLERINNNNKHES